LYRGWSVSRAVRYIIGIEKSYLHALDSGYANLTALANLIKPTVESILGHGVKHSTIVTALKRMRGGGRGATLAAARVIAGSRLRARTGLAKLTVRRSRSSSRIARDLAIRSRGFFQLLDGVSTITLIFDRGRLERVRNEFPPRMILRESSDIAALIIVSPSIIEETHGVVSHMLEWLAMREINVEEVVSCHKDTIILVSTKDGGRAFDALNELISTCRRIVAGAGHHVNMSHP